MTSEGPPEDVRIASEERAELLFDEVLAHVTSILVSETEDKIVVGDVFAYLKEYDPALLQDFPEIATTFSSYGNFPYPGVESEKFSIRIDEATLGTDAYGQLLDVLGDKNESLFRIGLLRGRAHSFLYHRKRGLSLAPVVEKQFRSNLSMLLDEYGIGLPMGVDTSLPLPADRMNGTTERDVLRDSYDGAVKGAISGAKRLYKDKSVRESDETKKLVEKRYQESLRGEEETQSVKEELERLFKKFERPVEFAYKLLGLGSDGELPENLQRVQG